MYSAKFSRGRSNALRLPLAGSHAFEMWFVEMTEMRSNEELGDLIRRHSRTIQRIIQLETEVQEDIGLIPSLRSLRLHERDVRRQVIEWPPPNRALALAKFRHLFGAVLLLRASLDEGELAHLARDQERFKPD